MHIVRTNGIGGRAVALAAALVLWITSAGLASADSAFGPRQFSSVGSCKTNWLYEGGVGVSTHYFPIIPKETETIANAFRVRKVAEQLEKLGASWFLFPMHHAAWVMTAPNATWDKLVGNGDYTPNRDIPIELSAQLAPKGIKLMLYVALGPIPGPKITDEARDALGGWPPSDRLVENTAAVWREFSLRYGTRVSGWWVDGAGAPAFRNSPNRERWFKTIADALRAGNPSAIVAFNPGIKVERYSDSSDFTAGEGRGFSNFPAGRWVDGDQWHLWTYVGPVWGSGGTRFSDEELGQYVERITGGGGALTLEVGAKGYKVVGGFERGQEKILE